MELYIAQFIYMHAKILIDIQKQLKKSCWIDSTVSDPNLKINGIFLQTKLVAM